MSGEKKDGFEADSMIFDCTDIASKWPMRGQFLDREIF
jgi:hypothetical protein